MLVLTRKSNQSIMIGDGVEISVLAIMGEKVRIGIAAPRSIPVFRKEVYLQIQHERGEVVLEGPGVEEALEDLERNKVKGRPSDPASELLADQEGQGLEHHDRHHNGRGDQREGE